MSYWNESGRTSPDCGASDLLKELNALINKYQCHVGQTTQIHDFCEPARPSLHRLLLMMTMQAPTVLVFQELELLKARYGEYMNDLMNR